MITKIAKDFAWEMGHRLPFHDGGCQNIHGHSYTMRVELEGEIDERGMVMDYFDLKAIVQPVVDSLDHSFLCDESDTVMTAFFAAHPMKVNRVAFPTTAENIALYILSLVRPQIEQVSSVQKLTVRVHETKRTYAEVSVMLEGT